MELMFLLLVGLILLAVFDFAATEFGADSRYGSDDQHAPISGAH